MGFNPLPWFFNGERFDQSTAPPLADIYRQIRESGFTAVHAEVSAEMSVHDYRRLLADSDLDPAPATFTAFSDSVATAGAIQAAKRVAIQHAQPGPGPTFHCRSVWRACSGRNTGQGVDADTGRL